MTHSEAWSPEAYARFAQHRSAPFEDLLKLVSPKSGGTLLDLGCGSGALTAKAHRKLQVASTLGVDSSKAMLSTGVPADGVRLEELDLSTQLPDGPFDRIISNSALNWLDGHRTLLPRILERLAPGGELAVQVPSNPEAPFSQCAMETAKEFTSELRGYVYRSPVETPEVYAELLARDARVDESRVGTWYYPQLHDSVDGIVSFAQGGLLSAYRWRLSEPEFERFTERYRQKLRERLGTGAVFFPFRRVFFFAKRRLE